MEGCTYFQKIRHKAVREEELSKSKETKGLRREKRLEGLIPVRNEKLHEASKAFRHPFGISPQSIH